MRHLQPVLNEEEDIAFCSGVHRPHRTNNEIERREDKASCVSAHTHPPPPPPLAAELSSHRLSSLACGLLFGVFLLSSRPSLGGGLGGGLGAAGGVFLGARLGRVWDPVWEVFWATLPFVLIRQVCRKTRVPYDTTQ